MSKTFRRSAFFHIPAPAPHRASADADSAASALALAVIAPRPGFETLLPWLCATAHTTTTSHTLTPTHTGTGTSALSSSTRSDHSLRGSNGAGVPAVPVAPRAAGTEWWVDVSEGHNLLAALYLRYCGNKSVAVEHKWQVRPRP